MNEHVSGDFWENNEEPDWYRQMIDNQEINVVHNALVTTLGYTAEQLDESMHVENIVRGEDFALVFETDHPMEEGAIVRALFTISPPGALAVAHMILRRFPKEVIADIMYQAVNNPGPTVQYDMKPSVPPSPEGLSYIREKLDKQAKGYGNG